MLYSGHSDRVSKQTMSIVILQARTHVIVQISLVHASLHLYSVRQFDNQITLFVYNQDIYPDDMIQHATKLRTPAHTI